MIKKAKIISGLVFNKGNVPYFTALVIMSLLVYGISDYGYGDTVGTVVRLSVGIAVVGIVYNYIAGAYIANQYGSNLQNGRLSDMLVWMALPWIGFVVGMLASFYYDRNSPDTSSSVCLITIWLQLSIFSCSFCTFLSSKEVFLTDKVAFGG